MYTAYALLLGSILLGIAGQLLLKYGMSQQQGFKIAELLSLVKNLPVVSGFICYGVSILMYFKVLANLDLSLAYPTISLGYVMVVLLSKMLFKEPVSSARWLAVFFICAGVVLVGITNN